MCGVKTNILTSVIVTDSKDGDSIFLKYMLEDTADNFKIKEVSADKAYSSRKNLEAVDKFGGVPFIAFRSDATGRSRGSPMWKKTHHYFMYNHGEFMQHYHKRSNAETAFHIIKTKFGDSLKSKTRTAQINDILCKVLCHDMCVLVHEMRELQNG